MNEMQQLQNLFNGLTLNVNLLTWAVVLGILLDFATGIAKGYKTDGRVSSSKLRDGGFKKAGIVLVVLLAYGLSGAVWRYKPHHFQQRPVLLCLHRAGEHH